MGKQFKVRKPRKEGEEQYGTGDLITTIEEVDLDRFQNDGWEVVTDRDGKVKCCEQCTCVEPC